jgi:putative membrane protein
MVDEANMGDSAGGKMATTKGTRSDVRAFGALMMRDHHALRVAGLNLVKKLNLTPTPPPDDSLPAQVKVIQDSLSYLSKGQAWDKAYIDGEVNVHTKVLAVIDAAETAATAPELKALLTKARPNIEMHLKRAQEIQSKLMASPTAKP